MNKPEKYKQFVPLFDFLLKENMEYMQSELRCEQKANIHYISETKMKKNRIDNISNPTITNNLSIQMRQNQDVLQKVSISPNYRDCLSRSSITTQHNTIQDNQINCIGTMTLIHMKLTSVGPLT